MDLMDKLASVSRKYADTIKAARDEMYLESSHANLTNSITKRFNTATIGCLDILEKQLGDLWGHGLMPRDCTKAQLELRERWKVVRGLILDHGHGQKRLTVEEVQKYTVKFKRYSYVFVPIEKGEGK